MYNETFECPGCGKTRVFTRFCTVLPWHPTPSADGADYKLCGTCLALKRSPILKTRQRIKAKISAEISKWWEKTVVAQLDEELDAARKLSVEQSELIQKRNVESAKRRAQREQDQRKQQEADKQRERDEKRRYAEAIGQTARNAYGPNSARVKLAELKTPAANEVQK